MTLMSLVVLLVVAGVIVFLIQQAPFIDATWKTFASYAVLVFVVLYLLFAFFGGGAGQLGNIRVPTVKG